MVVFCLNGEKKKDEISLNMVAVVGPGPLGTRVDINITEQTRFAIVHSNARTSSGHGSWLFLKVMEAKFSQKGTQTRPDFLSDVVRVLC